MFVPHKPHPFGNKYHTIACALYKVIDCVEIVERKDRLRETGRKEFDEKGDKEGLLIWVYNTPWSMGKVVARYSGFCVLEEIILMVKKGVFGSKLVKKWRYYPKLVSSKEIIQHMQRK